MKIKRLLFLGFMVALLIMAVFTSQVCATSFGSPFPMMDLGTLGGSSDIWAYGINNSGQVVGTAHLSGDLEHAWKWENGEMTELRTLGGSNAGAKGINDKGQAVGEAQTLDGLYHACIWENGEIIDLGILDGNSYANGINDKGQVVGTTCLSDGSEHAWIWENGKITILGTLGGRYSFANGINDKGQVIGASCTSDGYCHACIWEDGKVTDLGTLGGSTSNAQGINNKGQVVGRAQLSDNSEHAFIWEDGKMADLGALGGEYSMANGINDKGQVVGTFVIPNDSYYNSVHAWIWENGKVTELGNLGGDYSEANGINDKGQVAGYSFISYGVFRPCMWEYSIDSTPSSASFGIHVNADTLSDVSVNISDSKLSSVMNGTGALIPTVDYNVSGSNVTISKFYLNYYFKKFPDQNLYLHFNFECGSSAVLAIYTGYTPHVEFVDRFSYMFDSDDARMLLILNGNFITSVKNGNELLVPRIDYTYAPSTKIFYIRKGYLNRCFSKSQEPLNITVGFTGDPPKTVVITPEK
ncbi:MAG TPA: X2-like carbohydrate binding domain-containing protein [Clostridia bacterium]